MAAEIPHVPWTTEPDDDEPSLLDQMRDGAWLDAQTFPPLRYVVPGLLAEGLAILAGAPKAGKSWWTLDVALAAAAGGRALGGIVVGSPRPVLLLALEDGDRRLQDRCRRLLHNLHRPDDPIPAALHYLTQVQHGAVLSTIAEWLTSYGPQAPLVILDTLGKASPPAKQGETTYQRDYRVGSALKRLVDAYPGSTLLANHHTRKGLSEDFLDAVSGTQGIAGAADSVLVLTRPRDSDQGLLSVTGRDIVEGQYALRFDAGAWLLDGADLREAAARARQRKVTAGLGDRSSEIVAVVSEAKGEVTPSQVAEQLGMNNNDAGQYLRRLAAAERIEKVGRGRFRTGGPSEPPS